MFHMLIGACRYSFQSLCTPPCPRQLHSHAQNTESLNNVSCLPLTSTFKTKIGQKKIPDAVQPTTQTKKGKGGKGQSYNYNCNSKEQQQQYYQHPQQPTYKGKNLANNTTTTTKEQARKVESTISSRQPTTATMTTMTNSSTGQRLTTHSFNNQLRNNLRTTFTTTTNSWHSIAAKTIGNGVALH
eukprot:2271628-Amphidinium_carterae.6